MARKIESRNGVISIKSLGGEKWGKSCTHSECHTGDDPRPPTTTSDEEHHFRCYCSVFTSTKIDRRTVPPRSGRKAGSGVGNPGEGGGERGGEPRGGQWGAGWRTPNGPGKAMGEDGAPHRTRTGEALEHHRRRSFTPSRIPLLLHDYTRPSAPLSTRVLVALKPATPPSTHVLVALKPMTPPSTRAQPTPTPTTPPSTHALATLIPMTPPSTHVLTTLKPTTPLSTQPQASTKPLAPASTRTQPTLIPMTPTSTHVLTTLKPTTPTSTHALAALIPMTPPLTHVQPTPTPTTPLSTQPQASMKPLAPPIATTGEFRAFFARRRCRGFHSTSITLRQWCCRFQSSASHAHTARRAPPGRPHTVNSQHTIHIRPCSAPTPHARLRVIWLLGGRMCMMVAQHS